MYVKKTNIEREYNKILAISEEDTAEEIRAAHAKTELMAELDIIGIMEARELMKRFESWLKGEDA